MFGFDFFFNRRFLDSLERCCLRAGRLERSSLYLFSCNQLYYFQNFPLSISIVLQMILILLTSKLFLQGTSIRISLLFVDRNGFQNDPKDINMEPDDFAAVGG